VSPRGRIAAAVLAVVGVMAVCWLGLLAPKRAQVSAAQAQVTQAESRRDVALAAVGQAEQARAEYERDAAPDARLAKAVPADDDVGPLIKQLESIARANKIDFRAVKLVAGAAAPSAAAPPPPPAAEGEPAGGEDKQGEGATDETAPSTEPVAAVVAQPPPGTVVGPAGLLTVPFSFTFDGGYAEMQRFLKAVHGLAKSKRGQISVKGRLMTIDGFSLAAGPDGFPRLQALVSATAYVMPEPAATTTSATTPQQTAAAAPGAPGATG
jgi:Tfp pilus assembly protein PilO